MAFGTVAKIPVKPDLAVLGVVETIEPLKKSEKENSPFYSAELGLKAQGAAGRDTRFWLSCIPQFFTKDFEPDQFADSPPKSPGSAIYHVYKNNIIAGGGKDAKTGKPKPDRGALRLIAGADFEKLVEFSTGYTTAEPPSIEKLSQILQAVLKNRVIGYVLKQDKDEDGELQERYSVDYFFPVTKDTVDELTKSARSPKRKRKLVLTWEKEAA